MQSCSMLSMLVPCSVHVVACSYLIYALADRLGRMVLVPNYAGTAQRPRAVGTSADRCTSFGLGCGRRGRPSEPVHPSVGRTQRAGLPRPGAGGTFRAGGLGCLGYSPRGRLRAVGLSADRCSSFGLGCSRRGRPSEPAHPSLGWAQRAGLLSLQGSLIRRAVGDRLTLTRTG